MHIRRLLQAALSRTPYQVVEAANAQEALEQLAATRPDVVLLDLGLPDRDGLELIPLIRKNSTAVVLVISARDKPDQKVAALDLGADDYVTKPFDTNELLARIRAALRYNRVAEGTQTHLAAQGLEIDLTNRRVSKFGQEVHLTPKEYAVLTELAKFPGRVITHHHLLKSVWPQGYERHVEYLRVVIRNLRQKIEADVSRPTIIVNELGVGYRLMGAEN
jgi:two-component system KDP operon response regulator KdpE